jgi:tetratricopeptide (TPR) repeat protein
MFRYRWALPAALAGVRQELGDLEGAIGLWQRAADLRPDPETEASLLTTIARAELALKRGQPALDALERRRALASALAPRAPVVRSMGDLALEASALATLERFDEAVARCEEILAVTVHEEASRARRLTVHACLADLARIRGWADEALAQAEWCLAAVPQKARRARGVLRALRAATLADQARFEDAVAEAGRAAKAARDPAVEAQVCIVRARVNLDARRPGDALRHLIRADHLRAGSLETAYWLGVALRATDDAAGVERLRDLADRHPAEHWGRRAAASLA